MQHLAPIQLDKEVWKSADPCFDIHGNALVTDRSFFDSDTFISNQILHLSAVRNVQMVKFRDTANPDSDFVFLNTHLHHPVDEIDNYVRALQVEHILFWISRQTKEEDKVFLMGDFNAQPNSVAYNHCIAAGFKSAFKEANGQEPEITFPTGLQAEWMDTDPAMCLDYVFYKGPASLQPVSAELAGNTCLESDATIYPSDHMAIIVEFKF